MKRTIALEKRNIEYSIRRRRRSRRLKLTVNCDASVVLSVPYYVTRNDMEGFLRKKADWILERIEYFTKHKHQWCCSGTKDHFFMYKQAAYNFIAKKVAECNTFYEFKYNKIAIKNQRTRWGSCSHQGNLNFNYKLYFLNERLVEYVVVHELCHLQELNHSDKFWKLVEKAIPDYWERRQELMNKRT